MNLDTAFRSIYGRDPSPEETNRFNRIGKELDIRDNDAIWAIAFLLGHHLDLAKQMPEQIDKADFAIAREVRIFARQCSQAG